MSKLVDSHITVRPFIPKLLPGLLKVETSIGDPEARSVVGRAIATLRQVGQIPDDQDGTDLPTLKFATEQQLAHSLIELYKKAGGNPVPSIAGDITIPVACVAANAVNVKNFDVLEWDTFAPCIAFLVAVPEPVQVTRIGSSSPRPKTPMSAKSQKARRSRTCATASSRSPTVPISCSTR